MPRYFRSPLIRRAWFGAVVFSLALCGHAMAGLPFSGQQYPNGATDFLAGALPPPGVYLINYLAYIKKDRLMGEEGKEPVDFDVDAIAEVPRLIWVTPYKLLGADWTVHAFFPFYRSEVNLSVGGMDVIDSDDLGMGDIIFSPLALGWHFSPNFHAIFALDIWAPTGSYDRDEPASQLLSKNNWTFEPVLALTYLWNGFDFSTKLMYDFNTENDEYPMELLGGSGSGDLKPGQEFHFDWGVGYMAGKSWEVGASGYYYWQTTDDELNGEEITGVRSRVGAAGPTVKWWPNQGRFSLTVKHLREFDAKNAPEGHNTWANLIWAF